MYTSTRATRVRRLARVGAAGVASSATGRLPVVGVGGFPRLRITVERLFEVRERDHEAGPAIEHAELEHVVLDEGPDAVREGRPHRWALRDHLFDGQRRIAVGLVHHLAEVLERELPD